MKKILALLLAFAMLFAFAACGGKDDKETKPETTTDLFAAVDDDTTAAPADDTTAAVPADGTTAEAPSENASEAAPSENASAADTTAAANPNALNSSDIAEIVAFYNKAHKATKPAPKGHSTMKLDGAGALGGVLKVASPIIQRTLEKNSVETDYIPGKGKLQASDVVKAKAVSKNGVTEIVIQLKDQVDGPQADAHTAGPVARGIGTLGNIDNAIKELGAELYSGKDSITLTYKDAYIKCKVDEKTGKITGGTWHYAVHVYVGEAEIKLGLKFTAKNLKGIVDYTVTI